MAGISGACGGFIGTPGDMVNVRMQNDMKVDFIFFSYWNRFERKSPQDSPENKRFR